MLPLRPLLALLLVASTTAATLLGAGGATETAQPAAAFDSAATRLIVLGDTGTGGEGQYRVARAVEAVCETRGCDFAMITGDLIYETGVSSPYDAQFDTKFEQPYADLPLTFYLALGNHDNSDDLDQGIGSDSGKGDHMVAYHYRTDTSGKWFLPDRYFDVRVGDVELFSLDTNTMMSYGVVRKGLDPLATADAQDVLMADQVDWVERALAASDAPWRIAFGHHPLYSNGEHGDAGMNEGAPTLGLGVKNFLEQHVCGKVDLYLAGHDHDLQWLVPAESCGATQLIVSGAAAKTRSLADEGRNPAYFQQGDTYGFFWLELRHDSLVGAVYDDEGRLLFEQVLPKPLGWS